MIVYNFEVGVLLDETDEEFENYKLSNFYNGKFSLYNENWGSFLKYEDCKKYVDNYVKNGVNNTYGVIFKDNECLDKETLKNIKNENYDEFVMCSFDDYNLVYFIHKDNDEIKYEME